MECGTVIRRREVEFVALFGQLREFVMDAEIGGRCQESLLPARDSGCQGFVDIPECLGGRRLGSRIARGIPNPRENTPRFGFAGRRFIPRFVAEERVFESDVDIGRFEPDGLAELLPRGFRVTGLQERVGEIFSDIRPLWRYFRGLLKVGDGSIVIAGAQFVECLCERFVSRVCRLCERNGCEQAEYCEFDCDLSLYEVAVAGKVLRKITAGYCKAL